MRKTALVLGPAWMAIAVLVTFLALLQDAAVTLQGRTGDFAAISMLFLCAMPGVILFCWGRGPYRRWPSTADMLRSKAPYDQAAEAGHVLHVTKDGGLV